MTRVRRANRRGSVLPMLALCLIGLFTFVALAVDLGMLAVSRTQCQNAADVGALVGARTLNNKPGVADNNRPQAIIDAREAIIGVSPFAVKAGNAHLSERFVTGQVTNIQAGMYLYDPNANPPEFKANFTSTPGAGQSWTAMKVEISTEQPTYFMRVFGVSAMPTGAVAIAAHRPRDIAFALDMTGSMAYSSQFNTSAVSTPNRSLNPDNLVPVFGHYTSFQSNIKATANLFSGSTSEAFPRNNYTISTPTGPPIVRCFYFDPANVTNPSTTVTAIATTTDAGGTIVANLKNAFHRWSPPESGGNSTTYTAVTYDFAGYNAFHTGTEASPKGPTPAPDTFGSMTDGTVTYVGDRYRRADGSINKTNATWATGRASTRAAAHAVELLGYNSSGSNIRGGTGSTTITDESRFRDPTWERYGYDLDIVAYRSSKGNGNPSAAGTFTTLVPDADKFKGYSMGPGYWGKTFYMWPPDPRWGNDDGSGGTADPNSPASYLPTDVVQTPKDTNGKLICDWRRRFFQKITGATASVTGGTPTVTTSGSGTFDPQGSNTVGAGATNDGINEALFSTSSGSFTLGSSTQSISTTNNDVNPATTSNQNQTVSGWVPNYTAILKWIKSGPQVLPPNLRAGHIVYYTSIPDDVSGAGAATDIGRDKQFWKNYIDYVVGYRYTSSNNLYGTGDSWSSGASTNIYTSTMNTWTGPSGSWTSRRPYMRYNDSPNRPRLHLWFGPLSMMDFLTVVATWVPGTCYEGQNWQLKAGMSSVLDDIQKNHPNDTVGLGLFANDFTEPRVPIGQNFIALKNALFYPLPLLSTLDVPTPTVASVQAEYRPYEDDFAAKARINIPNASGSTDPNTGLMMAFNLLSPSANLPTVYGTVRGRRGASKIVILETDGVPNTWRGRTFNAAGYNSYYTIGNSSGNIGNNHSTVLNNTYPIVQQIVKNISSTTSGDSGLGLPNAKALVYPVGFGDLFDTVLAPGATTARNQAHAFLAKVAEYGGTGPAGATTLTADQIITGSYSNRISTLRTCMERIFQSGVSVTLIE